MRISSKAQYACLAILELARSYRENRPVRIRAIAEAHGIPERFLVQILLQLKGAGLVASTRGAAGGYQLARPPEAIRLGVIMTLVDGPLESFLEPAASPPSAALQVLKEAWQEVASLEARMLNAVTFADLAEQVERQPQGMYYI